MGSNKQPPIFQDLLASFGIRASFSKSQLDILNQFFVNQTPYPTRAQKEQLGFQLEMTVKQVDKWFIHRREREKKDKM